LLNLRSFNKARAKMRKILKSCSTCVEIFILIEKDKING
jgi:hypothetical protein